MGGNELNTNTYKYGKVEVRPLHIVYVIALGGGPESYVKTLAPWLIEQGHQVSVIYTGPKSSNLGMPEGVKLYCAEQPQGHYYLGKLVGKYRLFAQQYRSMEISRKVEKIIFQLHREMPIDVIELTEGYRSQRISEKFPVVVRAHGSDWAFRHFCQDQERKWDFILIQDQAEQFRHAHVISPLSKHYSEYLSVACDIPRDAFQEIPYPIDLDKFDMIGEKLPDAAPLSLMTIGRLEHRKGSDVAVQTMNCLWETFPEAHLYLLGSEAQFTQSYLKDIAKNHNRHNIIFPGFISNSLLPTYYRSIKLYLALTQYETFGYTLLEAMACGIPVISCSVGAVPELVQSGINGQLVAFENENHAAEVITNLLKDDLLRENMGRKAREVSLEYALPKVGNQHLNMYSRAMDLFASR
jgi:glycosyltransferase involved in cell wall biosynthesis